MSKYHSYFEVGLKPKDGIQGERGPLPYPAGRYNDEREYVMTKSKTPIVFLESNKTYYALAKFGVWKGVNPAEDTEGVWEEFDMLEYVFVRVLLAEFAMFGSAIFTNNKLISQKGKKNGVESYDYTDPDFDPYISIDFLEGFIEALRGKFAGTLEGVSGSFKRLNCVDENGSIVGSIKFGSDGRIWFEDCGIAHQAATGPFLTSDVWVRGVLGSRGRTALVITGTSWGYVYKKGLSGSSEYISLSSGISSNGDTYYNIPLYSPTTESSGMPIDLVIINHGSTARYNLPYTPGKTIAMVNSRDQNSSIYIYSNGRAIQMHGGLGITMACVGDKQNPDNSSWLGRGWLIIGYYDNQWT